MSAPVIGEPVLREALLNLCKPAEPATATVVRNELCTAARKSAGFIRHIEIDLAGTPLVGKCIPGQSLGVLAPGADDKGRPHKPRLYSLASPTLGEDGHGRVHSFTVKRLIDENYADHSLFLGVTSNYLCALKPGDTLKVTGPSGKRFVLPQIVHDHDYLFFATGTGIAPFRGMLLDLLAENCQSHITLVMGSPYATDLLYDPWLRTLAEKHPNFRYLTAISREADGPHGKLYVQDRLRTHADVLAPLLCNPRTLVYICGVAGMELGIFQQMTRMLPPDIREQYVQIDPDVLDSIDRWDRVMIHRQVRHTRRVFLEVYA